MLGYLFDSRKRKRQQTLILSILIFLNALALTTSNIGALSGFLTSTEVFYILIVNIVDMVFLLFITAMVSSVIDLISRTLLLKFISVVLAMFFIGLYLAFQWTDIPRGNIFAAWYLVSEQQWLVFPIIVTTLSGDIFNTAESSEVQPIFSSMGAAGSLIAGLVFLAVAFFLPQFNTQNFLLMNALIYVVITLIIPSLKTSYDDDRTIINRPKSTIREVVVEGWEFMWKNRAFTYLALGIVLLNGVDILIEFGFYDTLTNSLNTELNGMEQFYSAFRLGTNLSILLAAGLVTGYIIRLIGLKNVFFLWPLAILIAAVVMIIESNALIVAGVFALTLVMRDTIDEPGRHAMYSLVPDNKRGRVSILYDSYLMAFGTIIGSAIGLLIIWLSQGNVQLARYANLGYSAIIAVIVFIVAWRIRKNYDTTMLGWQLKRRKRGSTDIWKALDI